MVSAGASLSLFGTPVRAFHGSSLLSRIASVGTNRVLVIVQLGGGNDGLNTIVPVQNDTYYTARPGISVRSGDALPISTDFGFHPDLTAVHDRFLDGQMAVVHGVGYPQPNLSHFVSTDVWMTGRDAENVGSTGWAGRQLDASYPKFIESPPPAPLAVQLGRGDPFLFQGPSANMGMSILSLSLFEQIAETGNVYSETDLPPDMLGEEIGFVRAVANDSYRYAASISSAAETSNNAEYPGGNSLANNLAVVARLIKGRLGSSIYHVSLGGFDTHADQNSRHRGLMRRLAEAVDAFLQDLEASGMQEEVLVMTFSEFGRRVYQNSSGGTDHGTAAPMLLFGSGLSGGLYGEHPDLDDLDAASNLKYTTDFRSVYSTVLTDWFGLPTADVSGVFGDEYPNLSFVGRPTSVGAESSVLPQDVRLEQNYPNPFNPSTRITFTLDRPGFVDLDVYDTTGRLVSRLASKNFPTGRHEINFDAGSLPSGVYIYRLKAGAKSISKSMTLLR